MKKSLELYAGDKRLFASNQEPIEWLCFLVFEYFAQFVQGIPCSRKTSVGGHLKYGFKYLSDLNPVV